MIPLWALFAIGGLAIACTVIVLAALRLSGIIGKMKEAGRKRRLWIDDD